VLIHLKIFGYMFRPQSVICWPEDGRNAVETFNQKLLNVLALTIMFFYYIIVVSGLKYIHFDLSL